MGKLNWGECHVTSIYIYTLCGGGGPPGGGGILCDFHPAPALPVGKKGGRELKGGGNYQSSN